MHLYHLQRVQALTPDDYPLRVNFACWYLQQAAANPTFPADVLFTDEATFSQSAAYKHADGKKIDGRRVLVDVERGRTVKGWLPRRLGGGLGGTRRGGPEVNVKHSGREEPRAEDRYMERERERTERPERRRSRSRSRERRRRSRSRERHRSDRHKRERSRERERGGGRDHEPAMGNDHKPDISGDMGEVVGPDVDRKERRRSRSRDRDRKRRRSRSRDRNKRREHARDRDMRRQDHGDRDDRIKEDNPPPDANQDAPFNNSGFEGNNISNYGMDENSSYNKY